MPVPGKQVGEQIEIYSSEDGNEFSYLGIATVQEIQGEPYVIFFTDHFSVLVTAGINGTSISADNAANATSPQWTTLSGIVIQE